MTPDAPLFDPDAVMDAMAPLLGLTIRPDYRQGIATNLLVTARWATLVVEAETGDDAEPAPIFVA